MRAFAASLAASILVGSTSSAAMLDDTSNASTTVPSILGTGSVSCGRAEATASRATPIKKTMGRNVAPPPSQRGRPFTHDAQRAQTGGVLAPPPL